MKIPQDVLRDAHAFIEKHEKQGDLRGTLATLVQPCENYLLASAVLILLNKPFCLGIKRFFLQWKARDFIEKYRPNDSRSENPYPNNTLNERIATLIHPEKNDIFALTLLHILENECREKKNWYEKVYQSCVDCWERKLKRRIESIYPRKRNRH